MQTQNKTALTLDPGAFFQHQWLLDEGGSVDALFCAAAFGQVDMMQLLVDYKSDVNKTTPRLKLSAAFLASAYGRHSVLRVLVKAKADVDMPDLNKSSPLFAAAFQEHCRVIDVLADAKADLHACNNDSETPLYVAAKRNNYRAIYYLLQQKADANRVNVLTNRTPIEVASHNNNTEALQQFRTHALKQEACGCIPLADLEGVFMAELPAAR